MTERPPFRLAVLIDAENIAAGNWPAARATIERFGVPELIRAYFCHEPLPAWAILPEVEIIDGRPAGGPNAADFLMAMDAVSIAAEGWADGFVLVTGDDGFSVVARELKKRGVAVYALLPLHGCAVAGRLAEAADLAIVLPSSSVSAKVPAPPSDLAALILDVLFACPVDEHGWTELSFLGSALRERVGTRLRGRLRDTLGGLPHLFEFRKHGTHRIEVRTRPGGSAPSSQA